MVTLPPDIGRCPVIGAVHVARKTRESTVRNASAEALWSQPGKWALSPVQVDVLNEVFTPRQEDFDKAKAILDAYRKAVEVDRTGAVMLGDEMIDEASRKMAILMVERGEALGLKTRS